MKSWLNLTMPLILGVTLLVAPLVSPATAQVSPEAMLVVSIESIDDLLEHGEYLEEIADVGQGEDIIGLIRDQGGPFFQVLDTTQPIGAALISDDGGNAPYPLVFVPVSDFDSALNIIQGMTRGAVEDHGNGLYSINAGGLDIFFRNEGDWVFVSNSEAALDDLPSNPEDYLGELPDNYAFAVQGNLQNIPDEFVAMAIAQVREGMERGTEQQPGETDEAYQIRLSLMEGQLEQLIAVVQETDQITLGWAVDDTAATTYLDISSTFIPGSELAGQIALLEGITSDYAGFLMENAAATFNAVGPVSDQDAEKIAQMLDAVLAQALGEIDSDSSLESEQDREAAKEVISDMFGIIADTIKSGKIDGGGAVILDEEALTAAFGFHVADGEEVLELLHQVAEVARNEPDFPGIVFDDDSHAGVSFHTMEIPVPDDDARMVFGDELLFVIGTGEESVYVALGSDPIGVLKTAIDNSAAKANDPVSPFQFNIAIKPIIDFAASVADDDDLVMISNLLDGIEGRDHISFSSSLIDNGINYRLTVEDGIIQAIGLAIGQTIQDSQNFEQDFEQEF